MQLQWRPYCFRLPSALVSAQGRWLERRGWLLRLQGPGGCLGWGEVPQLPAAWIKPEPELLPLQQALEQFPLEQERSGLEAHLPELPSALALGLGMAWLSWMAWARTAGSRRPPPPSCCRLVRRFSRPWRPCWRIHPRLPAP